CMVPRAGRESARRESGVNPSQISPCREPELPLVRNVVALGAEHEFMHAIAELHCLEHVVLHGLYVAALGSRRNVEPEIPEEICVPRIPSGILAELTVEETVVVFAAAGYHEMLAVSVKRRQVVRVGVTVAGKRRDAPVIASPANAGIV